MAEKNFKLGNTKCRFFIDENGQVIMGTDDNSVKYLATPIMIVEVRPSDDDENYDLVKVSYPKNTKVQGIKLSADRTKVDEGQQAYQTEKLLKTLWIKEVIKDGFEYDESDSTLYIDCFLAESEKSVNTAVLNGIIKEFKACRKKHNDKCPAEPPKPAEPTKPDDKSKKSGDSDGGKPKKSGDSDGGKPKDEPKDKPKDKPKKRQPRKADESATGAKLEHITQKQADLDTHATLVAIGGEDFAKHFNGLVWDESTQTYKDET